ncbi:MAG: metalloregulator ArsR/SmtB family transcription factor [Pseudomonadota bacterium]
MDTNALIKCFKALSDPTRLRLFYVLQHYELNVNEIVMVVGMIQSGVSRHLKILVDSDLLTSRKDGSFIYYSIAKNQIAQSLIFLIARKDSNDPMVEQDMETAREMIHIRQNRTKRFFKSVAPQWDRLKKEVFKEFDLNLVISQKIEFSGFISDLGCGTGELVEQFASRSVGKIIGIDSSPEMLDQARKRLAGNPMIELRLGELEHLPMKNKEIDTAVMNMVLHHISQPRVSISEVFRVLKPGGVFVLSDFEKHDNEKIKQIMGGSWMGFEQQEIKTWLTESGFIFKTVDSYAVNHELTINMFTAKKP